MELVEPIKLTEDMVGDMFETREGKVVCLSGRRVGGHPTVFSTHVRRTIDGWYFNTKGDRRDLVRHLPRSKYPEYYL